MTREKSDTALFQEEPVDISRVWGVQMVLVGLGTVLLQHFGYAYIAAISSGVALTIAGIGLLAPTGPDLFKWRMVE